MTAPPMAFEAGFTVGEQMEARAQHPVASNKVVLLQGDRTWTYRQLRDESVRTVLAESQGRIRAMALVHEKLYRSENLARINFGDYLRAVTDELGVSHGRPGVTTTVEAEPIFLQIDTAIPCGLMVNELITNALKQESTMGMMLIQSLAVQISGTIRVTTGGGTHFMLTFPV